MTKTKEMSIRQIEIIVAAGQIMTDVGLGRLTTKNLANAVGFSESAIYRHFKSKEEIVISLLDYLAQSMDNRLELVLSKKVSAKEAFNDIFQSQFQFFTDNPHFVVAVFSDGLIDESKHISEKVLKLMSVKNKHLIPVIVKCQIEGIFRNDLTAKELASSILGTFRLLMFQWRATHFAFNLNDEGNNMIRVLKLLLSK